MKDLQETNVALRNGSFSDNYFPLHVRCHLEYAIVLFLKNAPQPEPRVGEYWL